MDYYYVTKSPLGTHYHLLGFLTFLDIGRKYRLKTTSTQGIENSRGFNGAAVVLKIQVSDLFPSHRPR